MTASFANPSSSPIAGRFQQTGLASRRELRDAATDYFTKYYALHHLRSVAEEEPALVDGDTIAAIQMLFQNEGFVRQRQSLFFFRQAAEVLTTMLIHAADPEVAIRAMTALKQIVATATGNGHRAVVEAISSLPTDIRGPRPHLKPIEPLPRFRWQDIVSGPGPSGRKSPVVIGRSLVSPLENDDRLLVVKLAKRDDPPVQMVSELAWMNYLHRNHPQYPDSFQVPVPLEPGGASLFKLASLPAPISDNIDIHPGLLAIAFLAPGDYFVYPNSDDPGTRPVPDHFKSMMQANAYLFARLASCGIVHSAPIALFHNRIQIDRRRDRGRYEWFRAGRLDRWLSSCDFPNMGASGLRDFEHLHSFDGSSRDLYRHIGTHLLSLLLVAGSYFRNKAPQERGTQSCGRPVDARHLFDQKLFQRVIAEILSAYYEGFVGELPVNGIPLDLPHLTKRLIDELGVDHYMNEVLRAADQIKMSEEDFRRFLGRRGYANPDVARGAADITIRTGPHLGGFNQTISVPELIEAVGTVSAWCIAGRYWRQKYDQPL